jgi:Flp pilus assembly pilin Flp
MLKRFLLDESGAASIEYAVLGAMLSVLIAAGAAQIGGKLDNNYFRATARAMKW